MAGCGGLRLKGAITPLRERQLGARSECSLIHPNVVAAGGGASQKGQLGSSREGLCDELPECSVFVPWRECSGSVP